MGRLPENNIHIQDPFCSGLHAFIYPKEGAYVVRDNGSKNRTFLNGQKIYNSEAHHCQYHWLLTRTNPDAPKKHRGLSMFIVDLKSPGITIRPLITMAGLRTNEVFYEDVRVPKENLVGEKNGGWGVIMSALYGGGGGQGPSTLAKTHLRTLAKYVVEEKEDADENPWIADELADLYVRISVAATTGLRATALSDLGVQSPYGGGGGPSRLLARETTRHMWDIAAHILGPYIQLSPDSKWAPLRGSMFREYMDAQRWTIVHGSVEISKLILATWNLGLPRR